MIGGNSKEVKNYLVCIKVIIIGGERSLFLLNQKLYIPLSKENDLLLIKESFFVFD